MTACKLRSYANIGYFQDKLLKGSIVIARLPSEAGVARTYNPGPRYLASVVSRIRVDNGWDPLTRLASADENASASHPRPLGGEGLGVWGFRAIQRCQILSGTPH